MKRISSNYKKLRLFESQEELKAPEDGTKLWQAYGEDMTKAAKEGEINEVIGRDKELKELLTILARKTKDNPVLVGEAGVGKTTIVDKLALLMSSDKCPGFLRGKKLIDMTWAFKKIVSAGLLPLLVAEIEADDLIIFVDELHSLSKESYDELKPFLAKSKLHMIGGSTFSEYGQTIEKDGAMERRFQKIRVEEPTYEECMEILREIKEKYGDWHHVNYSPEALESFYKLSKQYIGDRFLPDKAIDLMDESGARIRIANAPDAEVAKLERKNLELLDLIRQKTAEGDYDAAAELSDEKEKIESQLEKMAAKGQMGPKITVTKEMVEKLVADKTGIPVESMKKGSKTILKGM
jgi:ATP-dependent Clp protease ATP-binding subunit ClpC